MRPFQCECGQPVLCEHTQCFRCGRTLGFDPVNVVMYSLTEDANGTLRDERGDAFVLCANRRLHGVCNGVARVFESTTDATLCSGCQLNRTIPVLHRDDNVALWQRLETAKRRMLVGLHARGLPVFTKTGSTEERMRFDFVEDQRSNPDMGDSFITTGYGGGVITINLLEADHVERLTQQELMGESYRTLLGHFRHEVGHYYYQKLIHDEAQFSEIFGDPTADYAAATAAYYENGPPAQWGQHYISAYAASHPLEDWAESFAHLLHLHDTMETAAIHGLTATETSPTAFSQTLTAWRKLIAGLNAANRSLGLSEPYPFVLNENVSRKLEFVNERIEAAATLHQASCDR